MGAMRQVSESELGMRQSRDVERISLTLWCCGVGLEMGETTGQINGL
jgi:hypothetical protein